MPVWRSARLLQCRAPMPSGWVQIELPWFCSLCLFRSLNNKRSDNYGESGCNITASWKLFGFFQDEALAIEQGLSGPLSLIASSFYFLFQQISHCWPVFTHDAVNDRITNPAIPHDHMAA